MAENYTRVPKTKDQENILPNEIRITSTGRTRRYISYGVALLDPTLLQQDDEIDNEQQQQNKDQKIYDQIVLKGMGQAINKTVTIAEVIKRRVAGLHQLNEIHSTTVIDENEPKTEGLENAQITRTVSAISITLSKKALDTANPGYQKPISADLIQPMQPAQPRKPREPKKTDKKKREETVPAATTTTAAAATSEATSAATTGEDKAAKKKRNKKTRPRKAREGKKTDDAVQTTDQQAPATTAATTTDTTATSPSAENKEQGEKKGRGRGRGGRGRGRGGKRRTGGAKGDKEQDAENTQAAPTTTDAPQAKSE